MPNFQISITNPTTNLPDITVSSGVLGIVDHSNYALSDEAGHLQADFSEFYKMLITLPNGNEVLYSSLGDGDVLIAAPSLGSPEVAYTYLTGDGTYWITVYALPTYSAGASYVLGSNPVYVFSSNVIYKLVQSGSGQTPADSPTYWEEVSDIDSLPSKYKLSQRAVIYADAKRYYARKMYNVNCLNNIIGNNWEKLLRDPDFITATKLFIGINSIPILLSASRYDEIDTTINLMKQIASNEEVI